MNCLVSLVRRTALEKSCRALAANPSKTSSESLPDLAASHGVIPLLHAALVQDKSGQKQLSAGNSTSYTRLEKMVLANAAYNIRLTEKIFEMARLFEEGNIRSIAFKGPALAIVLYGDISMRQISDLDFLIHPDDLHAARILLEANGFQVNNKIGKEEDRLWEETECGYDMSSLNGDLMVDIRSRITPAYLPFRLTAAEVFAEQTTYEIEGRKLRTFSMEMQVLLLCFHGAKHLWHRLSWIVDIALFVQNERIDWHKLFGLAERAEGTRVLSLGLRIAERIFSLSLPGEVDEALRADASAITARATAEARSFSAESTVARLPFIPRPLSPGYPAEVDEWLKQNPVEERLVRFCTERLNECRPEGSDWLEEYLFYLSMRTSSWGRICYIFKALFSPTCSDMKFIYLPRHAWFLYSILRPLRLTAKILARLVHPVR